MKKWILISLSICMACAGVTYAGWTDRLDIKTSLSSGSLALAFGAEGQNYSLTVRTAEGGSKSYSAKNVECLENYALFSIEEDNNLFAELLGCSTLELSYPIMERTENTIADYVILEPLEVMLICDKAEFVIGEHRIALSEEQRAAFAPTLKLSVKQEVCRDTQTGRVTQVYVLDEESRRQLEMAMQLTVPQELTSGQEATVGEIVEVRLEASYFLSIPLHIGQAEENM